VIEFEFSRELSRVLLASRRERETRSAAVGSHTRDLKGGQKFRSISVDEQHNS
jgi:hypothetical protein